MPVGELGRILRATPMLACQRMRLNVSSSMRSGREKSIASFARDNSNSFPWPDGRLVALIQGDAI